MTANQIKTHLAQVFEQDYQGYDSFVKDVIDIIFTGEDAYEALPVPEDFLTDENRQRANASGILQIHKVGTVNAEEPIDLFDITLSDKKELQYNRVGIQQFIRSTLFPFTSAFMLFHNETTEGKDWRFSYAYKETTIKGMTSAKRYTYLFGKNHRSRTASERFAKLADEEKSTQNLLQAFSVEALSKNFFNEYKGQYDIFCKFLFDHKNDTEYFGSEFTQWEDKFLRDYVKKMMGRITFIYFLQRKGWMNGNMEYMQKAFEQSPYQDNYLDAFLEPLFFGVLNTKPEERKTLFEKEGWALSLLDEWKDVPYLNGGLFERDEQDEPKSKFPAELFKGLFDFYSRYNFTIDENDPDDAEVGVDPEMLGHIFENLLEDNKDKGAFYTPKEIVQYMSQESIAQYLKTHTEEALHPAIDELIKEKKVNELLQNKALASAVYALLQEVKVCDPAIGSGAFPMGVLNVLFHARLLLYGFTKPMQEFSPSEVKREIIQNNIYGVDYERGAVDIARLRFWLSIVVDMDSEKPEALPNFDYKFMQGNSLLESFEGFDLSRIAGQSSKKSAKDIQLTIGLDSNLNEKNLQMLMKQYFSTVEHEKKSELRKDINNEVKSLLYNSLGGTPSTLTHIEQLDGSANSEFFLWHTWFKDVFDSGGFDIVIGNPPYIKEGRMSKGYFAPYKSSPYYKGKMDIWYLFACNGLDLLNDKGVLCFIATNNWVTSFGASKLRNKVIKETRICNIVDFGAVMMFESASIQTMIMLFQKDRITDDYSFDYRKLIAYRATEKDAAAILTKTAKEAEYYSPTIRRANFIDKNITFSRSADILSLMEMVDRAIHLYDEEIAQGIVPNPDIINSRNIKNIPSDEILLNDIKVGDGVFVVDEGKFLGLNETESKYLKNLYEPTNCHKFYFDDHTTKKIIYITKQNYNHDAPSLLNHLSKYRYVMEQRRENQNGRLEYYHLHWPRIESYFKSGAKILVPRKSTIPIFTYTAKEAYVMMAINIIKTNRVNMKYLTGLLNSRLIEFWLKNKGKMQGANYQLDKEPLMQIPIAVPDRETQDIVARLVDVIILLKSSNQRASNLVTNDYLANEFGHIIDGCVYEMYFPDEMSNVGVSVVPQLLIQMGNQSDSFDLDSVWPLYSAIDKTGVIESIKSLSLSKSELLRTIALL